MPSNPTRSGWDFTGWNTSASATSPNRDSSDPVTEPKRWFAIWEATVTFNYNDGRGTYATRDVTDNHSFSNDGTVSMPSNPSRSGWDFIGWSINSGADNSVNRDSGDTIT
jgi:uncharacterized repeat protein (TIGR02543 family)